VSATIAPGPQAGPTTTTSDDLPERGAITRAAAGIGVYAGAFGLTFGAVAAAAGLNVPEVAVMSAVMFTGASQFALVGILAGGGAPLAGVFTALLLGVRNAFYGVPVATPNLDRSLCDRRDHRDGRRSADSAWRPLCLLGHQRRALQLLESRQHRRSTDR
jgi:hypothetical protein